MHDLSPIVAYAADHCFSTSNYIPREPYDIQYVSIRRGDGSGALDPANPHPHGKVCQIHTS